jgi:hypothetical protein
MVQWQEQEPAMEMDFGRYQGQLRPLTHRDFVVTLEVEAELEADLERAERRKTDARLLPLAPVPARDP